MHEENRISDSRVVVTALCTLALNAAIVGHAAPLAPTVLAAAPTPAPHPHIHEALESMRGAKHELETAVPDFHGHRVKAIEHLDQAIHEAEICEQEP
jgi:hypothetical protein